jgi:HK97 family phage portal protein
MSLKTLLSSLISYKSYIGNRNSLPYRGWGLNTHFKDNPSLLSQFFDVVYSCIERNSNSCAASYTRVYDPKGEELPDHPLQTILDHPNPKMSGMEMMKLTQMYLEIYGTAYWRIVGGVLSPSELWLLPNYDVNPIRNTTPTSISNDITGYTYLTETLVPEEMILFRFTNPWDPYGLGFSPLMACLRPSALLTKDKNRQAETLDNAARPSALVTPKGADSMLTDQQIDSLSLKMHALFTKGGKDHITPFGIPLDVTPLGFSAADSEQMARYLSNKTEILNAFGIPPALFDSLRSRAELDAALKQYARQSVTPRLDMRDDVINHSLAPKYDPRLYVESDSPSPDDEDMKLKQEDQDLRNGVLTIDEVRKSRGLAPGSKRTSRTYWSRKGK